LETTVHPDNVHPTRRNPITGYVCRRKISPVHFADAGRVVFSIVPRGDHLRMTPVFAHFTAEGRRQWNGAPIEAPVRYAADLEDARQVLADWADENDYAFQRMRHTWHATEVNPRALVSPVRIVDTGPYECEAIRNNPNGHVFTIGDEESPIYMGEGAVLATARRFHTSEGATFNGWIVKQGNDYSEPIGSKRAAISHLKNLAYELV